MHVNDVICLIFYGTTYRGGVVLLTASRSAAPSILSFYAVVHYLRGRIGFVPVGGIVIFVGVR